VEIDGFAFHSSRRAFEADRRRDAELQARGWRVVRITWRQLAREPERVVATIATLLAAR
jgi:very-short-patch-repair endonuclease